MSGAKGRSGGPRPNSGRPSNAQKYGTPIRRAEKRIADRLLEIIDRLFELAEGVTVQETDEKTGEKRVYTRAPDRQAAEYLANRIMGKPVERREDDVTHHVAPEDALKELE